MQRGSFLNQAGETMGDTLNTRALEFVRGVASAMGLRLEATVESTPDGPRLDLDGPDAEVLLEHKGEALQALQHIASAVFRHELRDKQRIHLDCLGFRRDKDTELRQMARFLADRARRTGVEQKLGPLNPYERRVVHLAIAEDEGATSESIGDAFMKTVIIATRKH